MEKLKVSLVIMIAMVISAGLIACGGGGGGDSSGRLVSNTSWNHVDVETDGEWIAWTAHEREKVVYFDGSEVQVLGDGLEAMVVKEVAFDGRYAVLRVVDTRVDSGDDVNAGHVEIYYYDTDQTDPDLVQVTSTAGEWDGDMVVEDGTIVWINTDSSDMYAYDISTQTGPVQISGTESVGTDSHQQVSGDRVVWDDGTSILYSDISNLGAFSAATDVYVLSATGFDPKIDGDVVVWEDSSEIYCDDLGDGYSTAVNISGPPTVNSEPMLDGTDVVWQGSDGELEIYYADVSDLSAFDFGTMAAKLTSNVTGDNTPQVAGGYVVWVSGEEIYAKDISVGIPTAVAAVPTLVASPEGFDNDFSYHEYSESWSRNYFNLDGNGNVVWTQILPDGNSNKWTYELFDGKNLNTDATLDVGDFDYYQWIKQVNLVDGEALFLARGAFEQVFARKADRSSAVVQVSSPEYQARRPSVDNGIIAWQQRPGTDQCESYWEINYADLTIGAEPMVYQATSNGNENKKATVDGTNELIAFYEADGGDVYVHDIAGMTNDYVGPGYGKIRMDNGIMAWRDGLSNLYYYDATAPGSTVYDIGTASDCPYVDDGIIAWLNGNDYYYYDILDAAPTAIRAVSDFNASSRSYGFDDGIIAFSGTSAAGTQGVFMYSVGDPVDDINVVWLSEGPDYEIDKVTAGDGLIVWNAEVGGTGSDANELFSYNVSSGKVTRHTNNAYTESKMAVAGGVIAYRAGGDGCNSGEQFIYVLMP